MILTKREKGITKNMLLVAVKMSNIRVQRELVGKLAKDRIINCG